MAVIVVLGGSGYLGQFVVRRLTSAPGNSVVLAFHSRAPSAAELDALGNPTPLQLDLASAQGLDGCLHACGGKLPDVIINCECETNPDVARALNVPTALLSWLQQHAPSAGTAPLLIHLSTDQVYDGSKAFNTEDDPARPLNFYGVTKLEAEKEIAAKWDNYAILRSSIIVGPPAPAIALPKTPPLVWMDTALATGNSSTFFFDEFRCPIFVDDLVVAIEKLIALATAGQPLKLLVNAGGPDRLSRADMAEVLAQVRGHARATSKDIANGAKAINGNSALGVNPSLPPLSSLVSRLPSASAVNRGVASPPDISMDTSRIVAELGMVLTPFAKAVELSFP